MKKFFLTLMAVMLTFSVATAQRVNARAVQEIVASRGQASQGLIYRSGLVYMGLRNGNEYHYGIDVRVKGKNFHSESDRAVYLKVKSHNPFAAFIYFKDEIDAMRFYDALDKSPTLSVGRGGRRNYYIERPILKDGWWMIDLAGSSRYSDRYRHGDRDHHRRR